MTDAPRTVTLDSGEKVQIGVDQANIVDVGSKLRRSTRKSQRAKTTRDNFEAALKKVGFHDWIDKDIDHVTDLAFEGKDRYPNLWPLNWEKNRHAFYGKWYAHHKIQYLDKKDPLKLKTGTLFDGLAGKHFTIERIAAAVPGYGGRSAKKP